MVSVTLDDHGAARATRPSRLRSVELVLLVVAAVLGAEAFDIGVYLHTLNVASLPLAYQVHLVFNLACLLSVIVFAWRVHGNLDKKLAETTFVAILVHGILAFMILGGRWYFSRPILLTNALESLLLGAAVVLLKHRIAGPRVALVRPLGAEISMSRQLGELITSPTADLTGFDVILVAFT
ncbi:MAG: hypothetical protein JWQ17_3028, partial [Tardiphaga sp.]|nr:hypothetical protein [Tardiphaga sp.]